MLTLQQPINDIHYTNAFVISNGKAIQCQNALFVVVADSAERTHFPFEGVLVRHVSGYLKIAISIVLSGNKVNFRCAQFTDIYLVSAPEKLKISMFSIEKPRS